MIDKSKEIINWSGKEYLEYLKYKDSKKKPISRTDRNFYILIGAIVFILFMALMIIQETLYPPTPTKFTWNGIFMFMAIAMGIGWIINGVGFAIIGRLK